MAKSARSSVRKRNNAKLRSTVFGPAEDARTARLSAKLQELASLPGPAQERKNTTMDVDSEAAAQTTESNATDSAEMAPEAMDVDMSGANATSTSRRKKKAARVDKKQKHKKVKNMIAFKKPTRQHRISKRK